MTLRKTQILAITSVTGISTVGIFTAGITTCQPGTCGTSYVKNVIMHNTGTGTCRANLYINPATNPVLTGYGITGNKILTLDLAPNETGFFESTYPIVLNATDAISVEIAAPDSGGSGVGSMVNVLLNGDTDIS